MCYCVISHMLRCDVRPVISNGNTRIVDSYARPKTCRCELDIDAKAWLRCDYHDCCKTARTTYRCISPNSCQGVLEQHRYTQVKHTMRGRSMEMETEAEEEREEQPDAPWPVLPVLDGEWLRPDVQVLSHGALHPERPAFRDALDMARFAGREIHEYQKTIQDWLADVDEQEGECRKVGGDCEGCYHCLENVQQALDKSIGNCQDRLFNSLITLASAREQLRKLESEGERRVSGL